MIRTLLATTAIAALMSTGAIAQDATPVQDTDAPATTEMAPADPAAPAAPAAEPAAPAAPAPTAEAPAPVEAEPGAAQPENQPFEMSAGYTAVDSDNLASELIDQAVYSSAGDDAEEIGNVSDVVFNQEGQITAVVIGVGGFLGIGEKSVAVPFEELQFVIAADNTERWVVETTAEALEGAPEFVWEEDEPVDAGGEMAPADGGAMAPADGGAMAPADGGAMAPATN